MRSVGRPLKASEGLPYFEDNLHRYILGRTRTGKTTFLLNLIKDELDNAIILLDPAGGLAEQVALITPPDRLLLIDRQHPLVINPLTRHNWGTSAKEFVDVLNACVTGTTSSPETTALMNEITLNSLRVFTDSQKNIRYFASFLNFEEQRLNHFKAERWRDIPDEYWRFFDSRDTKNWLKNKEKVDSAKRIAARLSSFYVDPSIAPFVVGANQFSVKHIVQQNRVCIVNLHGFDDASKIYLGNLISHAVKNYYEYEALNIPLCFYIDEFGQFISPFFSDMFAHCLKWGISITLAHQNHRQIDVKTLDAVLGNFQMYAVFNCGHSEAERMAKEFQFPTRQLMSLKKYEAYCLINNKPHKVRTFPPPLITPAKHYNFLKDGWISSGIMKIEA